MYRSNLIHTISKLELNLKGKRLNRKFLLFDSDDWLSIRVPDSVWKEVNIPDSVNLSRDPYAFYDSPETPEDLFKLLDTLDKYRDWRNNSPIFNLNCIVGHPDFDKIRKAQFEEYFWKSSFDTINESRSSNLSEAYLLGLDSGLFELGYHGREHINVPFWMNRLREGDDRFLWAFNNGFASLTPKSIDIKENIQVALNLSRDFESFVSCSVYEGINEFKRLFQHAPKSFIAANYCWPDWLEPILKHNGISIIKSMKYQVKAPFFDQTSRLLDRKVSGSVNSNRQRYITRNVTLEPTLMWQSYDSIGRAIKEVKIAFALGKPAIVDTHRINYVSRVQGNRERGLDALKLFIDECLRRWPDIEFVSMSQLDKIYDEV